MKKIIVLMTLLAASHSFAGQACRASYASGIGHVLKGEDLLLGQKEKILEGETSKDNLYSVTVKNGKPQLSESQSGKAVDMNEGDMGPEMKIYATKSLRLYPSGVPGAFDDHNFIVVLCADESAF